MSRQPSSFAVPTHGVDPPSRADLVAQKSRTKSVANTQTTTGGQAIQLLDKDNILSTQEKMIYLYAFATLPSGTGTNGLTYAGGLVEAWLAGDVIFGSDGIAQEVIFDLPLNTMIAFPVVSDSVKLSVYPFQGFNNQGNIANATVAALATQNFSRPQLDPRPFDGGAVVTLMAFAGIGETAKRTPLRRMYKTQYPGGIAGTTDAPIAYGVSSVMVYGAGDAPTANSWAFMSGPPGFSELDKLPLNGASPIPVPPNTQSIRVNADAVGRTFQVVEYLGL